MTAFLSSIKVLDSWKLSERQLGACARDVIDNGRQVFDALTSNRYSAHPAMSGRVSFSRDSVTVSVYVSNKPLKISECEVSPSLEVDTTGRNRQRIKVLGRSVPRAFIWNGHVFVRSQRGRVEKYIPPIKASEMLAETASAVSAAMTLKLNSNIEKRIRNK